MPNVSKLRGKTREVAIDFDDGDVLNVTYDPNYITPEVEAAMADAQTSEQLVGLLVGMVKAWDLTEPDGAPYALQAEALRKLPTRLLAAILSGIGTDISSTVRAEGKA